MYTANRDNDTVFTTSVLILLSRELPTRINAGGLARGAVNHHWQAQLRAAVLAAAAAAAAATTAAAQPAVVSTVLAGDQRPGVEATGTVFPELFRMRLFMMTGRSTHRPTI